MNRTVRAKLGWLTALVGVVLVAPAPAYTLVYNPFATGHLVDSTRFKVNGFALGMSADDALSKMQALTGSGRPPRVSARPCLAQQIHIIHHQQPGNPACVSAISGQDPSSGATVELSLWEDIPKQGGSMVVRTIQYTQGGPQPGGNTVADMLGIYRTLKQRYGPPSRDFNQASFPGGWQGSPEILVDWCANLIYLPQDAIPHDPKARHCDPDKPNLAASVSNTSTILILTDPVAQKASERAFTTATQAQDTQKKSSF